MKKIIYAVLILIIIVFLALIFRKKHTVIYGNVRYGTVVDDISFSGKAHASKLKKYYFTFNKGDIVSMPNIGSKIKKDHTLFKISSNEIESKLDRARIAYRNSSTRLKNLKITFKEKTRLFKDKLLSKDDFDILKNQMDIAGNEFELAKINLSTARKMFDELSPKAPFDGIVFDRNKDEGNSIYKGEYILSFGSTRDLYIESFLSEYDHNRIKTGLNVQVTFDYLDEKTYEGVIKEIAFVKSRQGLSEKYRVIIAIPGLHNRILIDSNCNIYIALKKYQNLFYFPEDALAQDKNGYFYYGIKKHYAYKTKLKEFKRVKGNILLKKCNYKNVILNVSDLNGFPKKIDVKEKKKVEIKGLL